MTTMERERESVAAPQRQGWSTWLVGLVAVLALLLGAVGGYMVRGDDDVGDAVAIGGSELTERQEEMLDVFADYQAAWLASDGEAAVSHFLPSGEAVFLSQEMDVDELADYVDGADWSVLEFSEPLLVGEHGIAMFHTRLGEEFGNLIEFTQLGEVLITSHAIEH